MQRICVWLKCQLTSKSDRHHVISIIERGIGTSDLTSATGASAGSVMDMLSTTHVTDVSLPHRLRRGAEMFMTASFSLIIIPEIAVRTLLNCCQGETLWLELRRPRTTVSGRFGTASDFEFGAADTKLRRASRFSWKEAAADSTTSPPS
mmetsp:Transcript_1678/g.4545  ORF Transcript_1678/g.4545 Transcript_1678/m.4545 type:complete len:149 (+) Transcript_1678:145-591(+)